ncbi:serine/threonine-protein phosphatase 7 long form protein [Trifolium repens]|nr:serine/threonine-protein phosphatase 7 long form protein [Trifolium repens]
MSLIHQQSSEDTIMEVRDDFMTSPAGDREETLRTAHFLKPVANSIEEPAFDVNPSLSSSCPVFEPNNDSFKIHFHGWRYPQTKWVKWVDQLKPKYESVWKKAGIFEAIMSTKSRIMKNQDLVYGVVEKWCSETNTFVFPFGEVTITLEDVMVLGGYSLIGDSVFKALEDEEMKVVEQKLIIARQERTIKSMPPSTSMWMDIFIDKCSEIEHEAFLATWLSIFVFPDRYSVVKSSLFPVAIHLARGNRIALAPAVLASLYKDLSLFKKQIVDLNNFHLVLDVNLQSPFYLVQVWVWERFKNLQPQPKLINNGDPVLLRWNLVKALKIDNVRVALDSGINNFIWRPYVKYDGKCGLFYPNDHILVPYKKYLMDEQKLSFVLSVRVSELVGFEAIEKYLPHRVAMQFGFDQDIPGFVSRFNDTEAIAWKNYSRRLPDSNNSFYFPARLFEADVTTRYAKWWKQLIFGHSDFVKNIVRKKRTPGSRKRRSFVGKANTSTNDHISNDDVPSDYVPNHLITMPSENSVQDGSEARGNINAGASSSLPPKQITLTPLTSIENCKHVLEDGNASNEARLSSDIICESGTQEGSYVDLCVALAAEVEESVSRLWRVHREIKMARLEFN